ncbi:HAD family hydrolase [Candidatus Obscuribacterales bacterium]|nr:HAD family hydrolase [Candidatus Obscuribacterales bacterium]MBX3151011.1 HAD family hydrolase [Candidatus Obscuribacterales bacterium]
MAERILLVLDLDETLIHAREAELDYAPDFRVLNYSVYKRPGLDDFLVKCAAMFELAVWSAGENDYVRAIVEQIVPKHIELQFVWSRERCTIRRDFDTGGYYPAKDLQKVRRRGRLLKRILIIDDEPIKLRKNYGNAIYVRPFEGGRIDSELDLLSAYLKTISLSDDVRSIEKRGWRESSLKNRGV